MQISRRFLLACVATICFSPLFLIAADTPAQIKARQALEQQLNGTPSSPPPAPAPTAKPVPPVAPAPVVKPVPPAAPAPIVVPPPVAKPAAQPVPTNTFSAVPEYAAPPANAAASPEAIEKARAALRQTMSASEPASQTAPVFVTGLGVTPASPAPDAPVSAYEAAKAKAAAEANANQAAAQKTRKTQKQSVQKQSPVVFQPMAEPSTGLAASKEQRLQDLLQQYKADAITPEQYHAERAKILAEP